MKGAKRFRRSVRRGDGATAARLTTDQKVWEFEARWPHPIINKDVKPTSVNKRGPHDVCVRSIIRWYQFVTAKL